MKAVRRCGSGVPQLSGREGGGGRENVAAVFPIRGGSGAGRDETEDPPEGAPAWATAVANARTSWESSVASSRARASVFAAMALSSRPSRSAKEAD